MSETPGSPPSIIEVQTSAVEVVEVLDGAVEVIETFDTDTHVVEQVVGGPQGRPGDAGSDGVDGVDGDPGPPGRSAYELALDGGFVGTEQEWLDSLRADASSYHLHEQITPDDSWQIQHDLGFYPNVSVIDSTGRTVYGEVQYVDLNTVRITFVGGFSGRATLS